MAPTLCNVSAVVTGQKKAKLNINLVAVDIQGLGRSHDIEWQSKMTYVHQTTDPNPGGTSDAAKQGKQKQTRLNMLFSLQDDEKDEKTDTTQ